MKKIIISFAAICFLVTARSQENMAPAPKQAQPIVITGATIHQGNGQMCQRRPVQEQLVHKANMFIQDLYCRAVIWG